MTIQGLLPFVLLSSSLLTSIDLQDREQRIRQWVLERFKKVAVEEREALSERIIEAYRRVSSKHGISDAAMKRIDTWTKIAGVHLEGMDSYRNMAEQHPSIHNLVLPNGYYRESYRTATTLLEVELKSAQDFRPLPPVERDAIHEQMEYLRETAGAMALTRIGGRAAKRLIRHVLDDIVGGLQSGIGQPFWGAHRLLSKGELDVILHRIEPGLAGLANTIVDDFDPNLDPMDLMESDKNLPQGLEVAQDLAAAFAPLYDITYFNHPKSVELREYLKAVVSDAMIWMKTAKRDYLPLYVQIRREKWGKEFRRTYVAKSRAVGITPFKERSGRDSSMLSSSDSSDVARNDQEHSPLAPARDRRPLIIGVIALLLLVGLLGLGIWRRRVRNARG